MYRSHKNYDYTAKIVILGDSYVGKSAIVQQFCRKTFGHEAPTTPGTEFRVRTIEVNKKRVKLYVWDTAGQEKFRAFIRSLYQGAHGIILCYAINHRKSFYAIESWMKEIKEFSKENVCVVLVGNKSDLLNERVVSFDEGEQKAESLGIEFFETSAKKDTNIDEAYFSITRDINKVLGNQLSEMKKLRSQENNPQEETECFKCC